MVTVKEKTQILSQPLIILSGVATMTQIESSFGEISKVPHILNDTFRN